MSKSSMIGCLSLHKIPYSVEIKENKAIITIEIDDDRNIKVKPKLYFNNEIIEHILFDECTIFDCIPSFIVKFTLKNEGAAEFMLNEQKKIKYDMQNSSLKTRNNCLSSMHDDLVYVIDAFFSICKCSQDEYDKYKANPYEWICKNSPEKKKSLSACLGKKGNSFIKMNCLNDYQIFMRGGTTENFVEKIFVVLNDDKNLRILKAVNNEKTIFEGSTCVLDKNKPFKEILAEAYLGQPPIIEECINQQSINESQSAWNEGKFEGQEPSIDRFELSSLIKSD
ncbi:hypothetical protein SteCoe_3156 [Stentor coeruleus]|uniref:Uncharacterized protein n=1 Tax=Stentor coeruleus TaxID=5963 RepID=A0A1R2CXX4_9CILI|nr:hypothetical protein SteCoe_3156 [Stentor coeruleus]